MSDYGKGALPDRFIRAAIALANERGVPVVVDPKGKDFSKYKGARVVTPNLKEASEALDVPYGQSGEALGQALQAKFGLNQVLVTMSAKGMVLVRGEQAASIFRQPEAREVFDVSGAGDAVAAIVALGLVEKWGTQPIYEHELLEAYLHRSQPVRFAQTDKKVTDLDHLLKQLKSPNFRSKEIVFTNGCFDILHVGHLTYLEKARSKGDVLVIGINSDQSISRIKGPTRPIIEEKLRARLLAGLTCVDFVVQFDDDTPLELIKAIRPHILIKGADWAVDKIVGGDFVLEHGGRVETIELVEGLSTSKIIQKSQEKTKHKLWLAFRARFY